MYKAIELNKTDIFSVTLTELDDATLPRAPIYPPPSCPLSCGVSRWWESTR